MSAVTDIEQKRAFVGEMYSSPGWKAKVRKMPDSQIFAIYMREQHKLNNHPAKDEPDTPNDQESGDDEIPF